jgi:hypothetical protein
LSRIENARDQQREARQVCIETMDALAAMEGVAGIHLMGHKNEDVLAGIIAECDLRKRPRLHTV